MSNNPNNITKSVLICDTQPEISLYMDDVRQMPVGQFNTLARSAEETIKWLETGRVTKLSLDHDMGEGCLTGYDVASWIERA